MKPKISVIVPIYNVEPHFEQCVNSIRNQTMGDIEIILVDDGSPDRCPQMCDEFAAQDSRIRVVHQENAGVSSARNRGMELAQADWIMFVDPDDWLENRAAEVLYQKAVETGCEIVCGSFYKNFPNNQVLIPVTLGGEKEYPVEQNLALLIGNIIGYSSQRNASVLTTPWGKIYRLSYLKNHGICFPAGVRQGQDLVYNLYAVRYAKRIYIADFPVYHYRIWSDAVSSKPLPDQEAVFCRLHKEFCTFTEKCLCADELWPYRDYMAFRNCTMFSRVLGKNINSVGEFFRSAQRLKRFARGEDCKKAIADLKISFMPTRGQAVQLLLLKCHMYRSILLIRIIYGKLFPNK